jgi:glycosyltransferase involved in cell wall biosynthesis
LLLASVQESSFQYNIHTKFDKIVLPLSEIIEGFVMTNSKGNRIALFLLFGAIEYDGRTKRMMATLEKHYRIALVDSSSHVAMNNEPFIHHRVFFKKDDNQVVRHLRLFLSCLFFAIKTRPKLVVAEDYFTVFIGWVLSILFHSPFIYDAHELIIPEKGIKLSRREYFWYVLERFSIKAAKLVVAANDERSVFMQKHYHLYTKPVVFRNIPPVVMDNLSGNSQGIIRRSVDDIVVLYQGDVCLERGIELFFRAVQILPAKYKLALIGSGPDIEYVLKTYFGNDSKFQYFGRVENNRILGITKQCDIGIIAYPRNRLNNIYCASNKIYEYIQAGIPVISTDQPPLKSVIEEYMVGEIVKKDDTIEFVAEKIEKISKHVSTYSKNMEIFLERNNFESEMLNVSNVILSLILNKP